MPFLLTWFHGNAILNARNQSNGGETRVISCIASCIVDSLIGSTSATAELYRDSSQASARVVLSGASALSISVSVNGTVSKTTYNGSVASGYKKVIKAGSNLTSARGSYSATKNGSSGSTSLSC